MKIHPFLCPLIVTMLFTSCDPLSKEAKEIVGTYYNTELSETDPIMELKRDATCKIRAIKPGVLTYCVNGKWKVEKDSLILELDHTTVTFEGDSSIIGEIPQRMAQKISGHNDFSLQLESGGITYMYKRRNE